ncbi:B12-binding domain-containing radical SAM protein [Streptantibioticus cattleyicolor]|uniref:2-(S-pantetheinyl)-carbapenam-3-carboxylate methyltransferase n=1 Tax=Streptantibioticus cattleyicolor (strain ATCC 35852 / DSM 46488 / JCM 4925 / NBRC 14057 / NRRL 8057) TaxID=1003195 RepID=THNK_STREN|nr:cobalamin-dependent protein [Streptantibioticus cattleyicolor]AEW99098.1 putative methyltransferase [Streptantibioticus cattleyicolor NRRL 8057 = DSM 46488]CAD18979.1 putative methyltransferase [Streptantibioticus cattleyicolor]CCB71856.1 putative methyltransferase [Streptantibioticus cattleyicolor NRRL 8057 = DSM 46488]
MTVPAARSGRKVYFIGLNAVPFLPLVAGLLRTYAEQDPRVAAGYDFQEPVFLVDGVQEMAAGITDPDVLALSCYVWNFRRQMKVARLVKERHPGMLVVAGGPHVPDRPGDFFARHPYVDVLVHGEGETAFRELLIERLADHPDYTRVPGVSVRHGTEAVPGRPAERLPRRIETPSPYLLGVMDGAVATCRQRDLRFYALWETNRGCPYSCAFCDWGSATMSALRLFDAERLQEEIEWFAEHDVEDLFVCDANFGILPRDLEIARALADARAATGAPKLIRVNFAKNSNDRVFEISKTWHDADLLMGTTLSMQSTDLDVLEAIDRKNIGLENYRKLQQRYATENIHTYTELILGLPLESPRSFRDGIGSLLEAGNHEDIRVYEFGILPNAPINTPEKIAGYGLRTVPKRLYVEEPGTPDDEAETVDMVMETNAMSRDEWVDCFGFVQAVQFLHNGCYTRYLSMYLRQRHDIGYTAFYERLQQYFGARPDTVLGSIYLRMRKLYHDYIDIPELPLANLVASQPDMAADLARYGKRRGWTIDNWGWLRIANDFERTYTELRDFVAALGVDDTSDPDLAEVFRFQQDVMLRPDYDPAAGRTTEYTADWPGYFTTGELRRRPVRMRLADQRFGANGRYTPVPGDLKAFARAAIGPSYPVSRIGHYRHRFEAAEVTSPAEPVLTEQR